jgi:integral membrane sensor domain MASE1
MPVTSVVVSDAVDKKSEPGLILSFLARQPLLRNTLAFCLFEAAFYVAYRYAMAFSHATPSPFWFPDSILLCALLLVRPRWWWLVLLAPLPIRLLVAVPADIPTWFLWAMFAIDSGKALFTATALKHFIRNPMRFETVRDFGCTVSSQCCSPPRCPHLPAPRRGSPSDRSSIGRVGSSGC